MTDFPGFPAATRAFLLDLRENNTRDWFAANKSRYENVVKAPALAWVSAMGARLQSLDPELVVDLRANGSGALMRAARDTRFSKDKSPYKTNIAMMWWHGSGKKMQHPGFGMQITPDGADLMTGMFHFAKPMLTAYRRAVADDELGAALQEAATTVEAAGYPLSGQHYKTVPRGFDKAHPRGEWLKFNALRCSIMGIGWDDVMSPAFIDICTDHFRQMAPILHWLARVQARYGGV